MAFSSGETADMARNQEMTGLKQKRKVEVLLQTAHS